MPLLICLFVLPGQYISSKPFFFDDQAVDVNNLKALQFQGKVKLVLSDGEHKVAAIVNNVKQSLGL